MSITSGFIKSKNFRTLSDLTHKLVSLWTAADTVEYTDNDLNGVTLSNTRPVSIITETDFEALSTAVKNNGYIYYVSSTDATTGKVTSYIYTKGVTYGVGDPSVELTWAEYQALPSTKETDGITYYITDRNPSESISIGAENVTYGSTTVDDALDALNNPTFTEASTRENIASGESFSTILGKIKKWFTDIPSMFVSKSGDTMSGALEINNTAASQLVLNRNHNDTSPLSSIMYVGNNIPSGTQGSSNGIIRIYGEGQHYVGVEAGNPAQNRQIFFPDANGTIALKEVDNQFTSNQTIDRANGTTAALGSSYLYLGNNLPGGTDKNSRGVLTIYGKSDKYARIFDNTANGFTANRDFYLPDKGGTIALTSDKYINYSSSQSFALSSTATAVSYDCLVTFNNFYCSNSSATVQYALVKVNGTAVITGSIPGSAINFRSISGTLYLKSGDTLQVEVGTGVTISSSLATLFKYANG